MRSLFIWLPLAVWAMPNAASAQAYWENGDFLRPTPQAGGFVLIDTGERYGGWRVVGAAGNAAWISGAYQHKGFKFLAQGTGTEPTTNAWVNLAGISQSATGIAHRPVPTTAGARYTLTFYVGNIVDPAAVYGRSSTVAVYENSRLLGKFTNSDGAGTNTEVWKPFSVSFLADAPWTTIALINGDPVGDLNCGVDNVVFAPDAAVAGRSQ